MQAAGYLVAVIVELAAGVEFGEDDFNCRHFFSLVNADGNSASVVFNGDTVVRMDQHFNRVAMSGHGLIDAVIHHFANQVVQPGHIHIANIHRRPESYRLKTLQNIDTTLIVCFFH